MRKLFVAMLAAFSAVPVSSVAFGQTAAPALAFDVASVRPAAPIDMATMIAGLRAGKRPETLRIEGDRATFTYQSLKELVAYGWKVRPYQVSGPEWLTTDRFDIAAKLPEGTVKTDVPAMMQALLIERFKIAAHLETKEHPVLGRVVAKGGSKLVESTTPPVPIDESTPLKPGESKMDTLDGPIRLLRNSDGSTTYNLGIRGSFTLKVDGNNGSMRMTADGMTLKGFANMLTTLGGGNGRPVIDMSGLKGNYQLAVEFSLTDLISSLRDQGIDIPTRPTNVSDSASDPGGDSTVTDALAKLGLKLEKAKAPIEQLVVDHIEKLPTEN